MFNIGPITDNLLNSCIIEFRKENNKEKIFKNIIDPLLVDISLRYYPYFILITIILILIIILLAIILIVMIIQKKK